MKNQNHPSNQTNNIRGKLINLSFAIGLGVPTLCWIVALTGIFSYQAFPHDKVATIAIVFSVWAPLLAFVNNKGEKRKLSQQLFHLGVLWFFSNTGYQLFWELPWFLLRDVLTSGIVSIETPWFWPWWSYGVADTRYLKPNDLILAITSMDASVAILEVIMVYLFYKNYKVFFCWMGFFLTACEGWGQYYFYISEILTGFVNIEDGWFGLYIKYFLMGFPWLVFTFVGCAGFMWYLATTYKRRGVQEYLAKKEIEFDGNFIEELDILTLSDGEAEIIEVHSNNKKMNRIILFSLVWPFAFLIVSIIVYYI